MSLKGFHIVFIVLCIVLAIGCAIWSFTNQTSPPFGIASSIVALALIVYGIWFVRKSKKIIT